MEQIREHLADPLYQRVITAKSAEQATEALQTLGNIRGPGAVAKVIEIIEEIRGTQ